MNGRIYGIGVGPGDPGDITLKAVRMIRESDVLIFPRRELDKCRAYRIVRQAVPEACGIRTYGFEFEMVRDEDKRKRARHEIYDAVKELVLAGKTAAFITIGDPALYSTFSYIAQLAQRDGIETRAVSGISSVTACANSLGISLGDEGEQVHIIPDTGDIEEALKLPGTKVIMKCGRDVKRVKELLGKREGISVYGVSDCGTAEERLYIGTEALPDEGIYMLTVFVKDEQKEQ